MEQRLIDRDNILKGIEELKQLPFVNSHDSYVRHMMREALDVVAKLVIEAEPTVEADGRKHGKWLHGREVARKMQGTDIISVVFSDWYCSECCYPLDGDLASVLYNYCPHCGTKMDG